MQSMTTLNIQRRTENRGLYEYRLVFKWADGVALGVGSYTLKRLLNHRTSRDDVTGGYTILTAEELREPADRVAKKLEECAGLRQPKVKSELDSMKSLLSELTKEQKLELMSSLLS
ncbi:MAG: hypothetical protein PWP74_2136 [Shewanella sp.]|uniref:Uncharacterized protein n=1 Tax=Shewanella fodinae TaxID=552357 RepID=A0A4R2F6X5_9GAMM|nr:hypothetical protein [Shewanella sp.]TCN77345.1 hypothetical protein EDC91_1471 [Shewanella fodinae]